MMKKCMAIGIILLFIGTCIIPAMAQNTEKPVLTSRGNWLYVGGSGPGNYSSIYEALMYVEDGDTIFVYRSMHNSGGFTINKSINLIGEEKDGTRIYQGFPYVIKVTADNVTIKGFTITDGSGLYWENAALYVTSDNNVFTDLRFLSNDGNAIFLKASNGNRISKNIFQRNRYAINCEHSINNIIINNSLGPGGIFLYGSSSNNTIAYNQIRWNNPGIGLEQSSNNIIEGNFIQSNTVGIGLYLSHSNIVKKNIIYGNQLGIDLSNSGANLFTENSFILNTDHAYFWNNWNLWIWNFWGLPHIFPHAIWGKREGSLPGSDYTCFQVDMRPRLVPHMSSFIKVLINLNNIY
jgi:parallel beta-helix repeat protein